MTTGRINQVTTFHETPNTQQAHEPPFLGRSSSLISNMFLLLGSRNFFTKMLLVFSENHRPKQPCSPISQFFRHISSCGILQQKSWRSEEHTSELQSLRHLVCRLLLEKKKKNNKKNDCRKY